MEIIFSFFTFNCLIDIKITAKNVVQAEVIYPKIENKSKNYVDNIILCDIGYGTKFQIIGIYSPKKMLFNNENIRHH